MGNRPARGMEFDIICIFCILHRHTEGQVYILMNRKLDNTVSGDELTRFLKALNLAFRNDVCVKPRWQWQSPSITFSLEFMSQTSSNRQEVWRKTNVLLKHMRRTRNTLQYRKYPGIPIAALFFVSDHDSHTFRCSSAPTEQMSFPVRGSENPLRV